MISGLCAWLRQTDKLNLKDLIVEKTRHRKTSENHYDVLEKVCHQVKINFQLKSPSVLVAHA
jgi:hypothetical protein